MSDNANPTNYLSIFILVDDLIFRTGFLATVESHCNVSFEILKVYTGTFQNTVDIRKFNALTHAIK